MTTDLTVSRTILAQLGGSRFVAMTGAKNFVGSDNALSFRIGRNACGVNVVRVVLDVDDTYRMEFCRLRKCQLTVLAVKTDVYCDQLQAIFTDQTGLYTTLGTMRAAA